MSGLVDRLRIPRIRARRAGPARALTVDGRPSLHQRAYGLGGVFGKTLRDSRRAILLGGPLLGLLVFFTASQVAAEFGTPAARAQMASLPQQLPPIFRGLLGEPISIERLGGFLSWRTINFLPILLGAWSIVALSSTLASEARKGSLDLVLSTPHSRLSIALQKAGAHVVAVGIATFIVALLTWLSCRLFATLPGDEVALSEALGQGTWLWVMALVPGSVAWLVAPALGRGTAAGLGALVMIVSFVATGYREALPALAPLDGISYFGLTAGHRPLAGVSDWSSVAFIGAIAAVLLLAGAVVFRTRDVGITRAVGLPLPRLRLGLGGPFGRSFAERLSVAAWWGLGLGALGFVFALNAEAFITAMRSIPQIEAIISRFYPGVDIFSAGGVLQLVFFGFGALLISAAAGMLLGGWASDETERRLEVVLSAPITRVRWAVSSGLGLFAAIGVLTFLMALLVGLGTFLVGHDAATPVLGTLVLGLYATALAGVGLAVGGAVGPGLAASISAGLGVTFYLVDTLGAALRLPQAVLDLSLTRHLGQPMAGAFDTVGIGACVALAIGGVIVAAVGLRARDVGR